MTEPISQEAIEAALGPIVGLPLNYWSRAADMADIGFGRNVVRDTGVGPREVAEYALHIQCDWRVVRDGRVLVGLIDYYRPPLGSAPDAEFNTKAARRNRQDDLVDEWLAHRPDVHVVDAVEGFSTGDVKLRFDDGCVLETFVWSAQRSDTEDEHWRFFGTGADRHFVVVGAGIAERPST